jgi:hypothetical protein
MCSLSVLNFNANALEARAKKLLSSPAPFPVVSQSITASTWIDGEYAYFKKEGEILVAKPDDKKKLAFTKNEKGEVVQFTLGDVTFQGDEHGKSEFIRYFESDVSSWCLFFTAKYIYIFDGPENTYPRGSIGAKCKPFDQTNINVFLEATETTQAEDIRLYNERIAEEARLAQIEKEKKFSIKDKEVSKLEIIDIVLPEKFGHYASFSYAIKATLADGSVLATNEGGSISDYEITYIGGECVDGKVQGSFIKDDKITISVVSRFNPAVKATADVVMLYNQDITFNYNAMSWSRSAGESANNFKIEVKQVKHKVNGTALLAIQITNVTTATVVAQFKIGIDQTLYFYNKGGNGGTDDGYGKDGGNGGNLTIIKDPSVKSFNLDYSNVGGKGGRGETSSYDGRSGRDGEVVNEVRTLSIQ